MHLKQKLVVLKALLEGSFFITKGLPHVIHEDIQEYSQACGKLRCFP